MRATKRPSHEATKGAAGTVRAGFFPASLRRSVASSLSRCGFTLTELLVVIALIVLIIAIAVPAFRAITGSRSVDAGENLVSAMLSRARGEAMVNNRMAGVAFFRDANNDRTGMAIVVSASQREALSAEPAGLEQYKAWSAYQENGTTATNYVEGDVVSALVDMPVGATPTPLSRRKGTRLFVCIEAHASTPAGPTGSGGTHPNSDTTHWGTLNDEEIDTLAGYEFQYLPPGIGAQTINDPDPTSTSPAPATGRDRYLRNGLILFDGNGALMHRQYVIALPDDITNPPDQRDTTQLYYVMGFDERGGALGNQAVGANTNYPIFSQLGVVLYDLETFKNAGGTEADPLNDNQAYGTAEPNEEQWLDQNGLNLLVNRYNGTLIRGE